MWNVVNPRSQARFLGGRVVVISLGYPTRCFRAYTAKENQLCILNNGKSGSGGISGNLGSSGFM